MTREQFFVWLRNHRGNFAGLTKWFADLKSVSESVKERWFETLAAIDESDANQASKDLAASPNKPYRYEDHPGEIVRRAKEMAIKRAARRDYARNASTGARCQWCNGDGQAAIFARIDPHTGSREFGAFSILADVQTPGVGEVNLRTFGSRCVCASGEKFSGMPQLDPESHVVAESGKAWRAATGFWEKVAARMERSSTRAFAGAVPVGGF